MCNLIIIIISSDHYSGASSSWLCATSIFRCDAVILHCLFTEVHRRPNRWIYDTGCTAHSAYLQSMFHILHPCSETMLAANGAPMNISVQGKAGPFFEDVLCLPDLRINLFSQKQAMRQNSHIALSADATIFQKSIV
jgi:hypothetical protein